MTLQATIGGLVPNGKIYFMQFKNMKSAYSMKLFHVIILNKRRLRILEHNNQAEIFT